MILWRERVKRYSAHRASHLQDALQLRDRREEGQISERGMAVARGRLEARLDRSLQRSYRSPRKSALANHLVRERDALFTS